MVAPIFFLVLFGGVEFASIHITQCAMENAAFEGVRQGIIPGATADDCRLHAENILNATGINDYEVVVEPKVIDVLTEEVSVTVTVPMTPKNKFGLSAFLRGEDLVKTISLPRRRLRPVGCRLLVRMSPSSSNKKTASGIVALIECSSVGRMPQR